jgi:hypothetical protein
MVKPLILFVAQCFCLNAIIIVVVIKHTFRQLPSNHHSLIFYRRCSLTLEIEYYVVLLPVARMVVSVVAHTFLVLW